MEPTDVIATARYRALVEQLGAELEHRYGWKSSVARRLLVQPSYLSKVVSGDVTTVGREIIDRAAVALGLRARFFNDPTLGEAPDYRQHVHPRNEEPAIRKATVARHAEPVYAEWEGVFTKSTPLLRAILEQERPDREVALAAAHAVLGTDAARAALDVVAASDQDDPLKLHAAALRLGLAIISQQMVALQGETKALRDATTALHGETRVLEVETKKPAGIAQSMDEGPNDD